MTLEKLVNQRLQRFMNIGQEVRTLFYKDKVATNNF